MKQPNGQEKKSIKVVLDTNVLISSFLFRKRLYTIQEFVKAGIITPCFTVKTFEELQAAFLYPKFQAVFKTLDILPGDVLEIIAAKSIILTTPSSIPNLIKEDPPDNHILACALISRASFIISGDNHLLKLETFHKISILSPNKFLKKF